MPGHSRERFGYLTQSKYQQFDLKTLSVTNTPYESTACLGCGAASARMPGAPVHRLSMSRLGSSAALSDFIHGIIHDVTAYAPIIGNG